MSFLRRAILIFLLVFVIVGCDRGTQNKDPEAAEIITEDIERFWEAYDAGASAKDFQEIYLDQGTKGLRDYARDSIEDGYKLAERVENHSSFYTSIRPQTLNVLAFEPNIREVFENLKAIYPEATFPDVYFVIGKMSAGGKEYRNSGLVVGTEKYVQTDSTPLHELNDWRQRTLHSSEKIPVIIAHELIHRQQDRNSGSVTLSAALYEGSADFIASLISGEPLATGAHAFAQTREESLWREFEEIMYGEDFKGWFGGDSGVTGRPPDLGYWMGYKIAEAYYEKAEDKTQAVADIIQMKDADAFLEASGYAKKFD